jgi:hypothetical protein
MEQKRKETIQEIIGYILLAPPTISVILFFLKFAEVDGLEEFNYDSAWTGSVQYSMEDGGGGGGYTSALPLYFGLMAIAGAYLIKNSKK